MKGAGSVPAIGGGPHVVADADHQVASRIDGVGRIDVHPVHPHVHFVVGNHGQVGADGGLGGRKGGLGNKTDRQEKRCYEA
jgi:hypothetical protein